MLFVFRIGHGHFEFGDGEVFAERREAFEPAVKFFGRCEEGELFEMAFETDPVEGRLFADHLLQVTVNGICVPNVGRFAGLVLPGTCGVGIEHAVIGDK